MQKPSLVIFVLVASAALSCQTLASVEGFTESKCDAPSAAYDEFGLLQTSAFQLNASLHAELSMMKKGALRKRAVWLGVDDDDLEEADDADDTKAALIELIMKHEDEERKVGQAERDIAVQRNQLAEQFAEDKHMVYDNEATGWACKPNIQACEERCYTKRTNVAWTKKCTWNYCRDCYKCKLTPFRISLLCAAMCELAGNIPNVPTQQCTYVCDRFYSNLQTNLQTTNSHNSVSFKMACDPSLWPSCESVLLGSFLKLASKAPKLTELEKRCTFP